MKMGGGFWGGTDPYKTLFRNTHVIILIWMGGLGFDLLVLDGL